uniref:Uncharacterized protein n=1 Tax=Allium cepa TaxID=4679 RepID=Q2XNZ8_ALLCE|nr:hypothetical protein 1.t00002 [Allium cepa]
MMNHNLRFLGESLGGTEVDEVKLMHEILHDEGQDELKAAQLSLLSDPAIIGKWKDGGEASKSSSQCPSNTQATDTSIYHASKKDACYDPDHLGMHKSWIVSNFESGTLTMIEGWSCEGSFASLHAPNGNVSLEQQAQTAGSITAITV